VPHPLSERPQVGLAGPSGSGKTVFSEKVRAFMPGALPGRAAGPPRCLKCRPPSA